MTPREGWLYLATWLDLGTREIVGYSMADHHRAFLVVDALTMVAVRGRLQPGSIVHSDGGSEYTSDELRCAMDRLGLRQSMGRTGSCYDNAAAESFFALLRAEIGPRHWPDRTTARAEIFTFIETFDNRRRLRKHPVWGCLTPLEIRQRHEQEHALAACVARAAGGRHRGPDPPRRPHDRDVARDLAHGVPLPAHVRDRRMGRRGPGLPLTAPDEAGDEPRWRYRSPRPRRPAEGQDVPRYVVAWILWRWTRTSCASPSAMSYL